jgi:hypothetical protein
MQKWASWSHIAPILELKTIIGSNILIRQRHFVNHKIKSCIICCSVLLNLFTQMEILKETFEQKLPLLVDAIDKCDFISIDAEFTGMRMYLLSCFRLPHYWPGTSRSAQTPRTTSFSHYSKEIRSFRKRCI